MNAWALLAMPWVGLRTSVRRLWVLFALACWIIAVALFVLPPATVHHGWQIATGITAFWLALMGLILSSLLLPALEARKLCLPWLERAAVYSVWANVLALLVLVVVPMALISGHARLAATAMLVGAAAGFAYGLLPAIWVLPLLFGLPWLQSLGHLWLGRSGAQQDLRVLWGGALFVLLVALSSAWSWRRLVGHGGQPIAWRSRPNILNFHLSSQRLAFDLATGAPQIHLECQTPAWLQPQARLGAAGPTDASRALRMVLGGVFLPVTWRSAARQLLLIVALCAMILIGQAPGIMHEGWHWSLLRHWTLIGATLSVSLMLMTLMVVRSTQLVYRWRRPGGALTVLSLLPGLGSGAEQTALLVQMLFTQMCTWGLPLLGIALLLTDGVTHSLVRTAMLLMILGLAFAAEVAAVYCTLGRRPVPAWLIWIMAVPGFVLALGGTNLALLAGPATWSGPLPAIVTAGCTLAYTVAIGLAARGRGALHRQPHPYLAWE